MAAAAELGDNTMKFPSLAVAAVLRADSATLERFVDMAVH